MLKTFRAPFVTALWDGNRFGEWVTRLAEISLDDAADLSNNTWGGPCVTVRGISTMQRPPSMLTSSLRSAYELRSYTAYEAGVIAFIPEEIPDVMDGVSRLLRRDGCLRYCQPPGSYPWRYRDGELHYDEISRLGSD